MYSCPECLGDRPCLLISQNGKRTFWCACGHEAEVDAAATLINEGAK